MAAVPREIHILSIFSFPGGRGPRVFSAVQYRRDRWRGGCGTRGELFRRRVGPQAPEIHEVFFSICLRKTENLPGRNVPLDRAYRKCAGSELR